MEGLTLARSLEQVRRLLPQHAQFCNLHGLSLAFFSREALGLRFARPCLIVKVGVNLQLSVKGVR